MMGEIDLHIVLLHFIGGVVFVWFALNLSDALQYKAFDLRDSFKPLTVLVLLYFITFFLPLYFNRVIDDRPLTYTPIMSFLSYTGGIAIGNILWRWKNKRGKG